MFFVFLSVSRLHFTPSYDTLRLFLIDSCEHIFLEVGEQFVGVGAWSLATLFLNLLCLFSLCILRDLEAIESVAIIVEIDEL